MKNDSEIRAEIDGLRNLTAAQLKAKHREVFGEQSRSNHKQFMFRRIAWRIQANVRGGEQVISCQSVAANFRSCGPLAGWVSSTRGHSHLKPE